MSINQTMNLTDLLSNNAYPGRGIVIGQTQDGTKSVIAYFIMGRSENSRNRIFEQTEDGIRTKAYDPSKLEDPSLIIYHPVREVDSTVIVTNGDQTDTIRDFLNEGKTFEAGLKTRQFEPDAPHFTSRISGVLNNEGDYKLSILKSSDEKGSGSHRHVYSYDALAGKGHFIHTYESDGNPLPAFCGEPKQVAIANDMNTISEEIWNSLHADNKISLYVRLADLKTGKLEEVILNKNG